MGKGEIARYEQFLLFPQRFQKACFPRVSKGVIVWEWVKSCYLGYFCYTKGNHSHCLRFHWDRFTSWIWNSVFSLWTTYISKITRCKKRTFRVRIPLYAFSKQHYTGLFHFKSKILFFNPFPHSDTFWRPWETSLVKTLWEKEKLPVQFLLFSQCFPPVG